MRIDPKYFNTFVISIAISAAIAIVWFSISYAKNQRSNFTETLGDGRTLYQTWFKNYAATDSVRASDFAGRYVVIDFWSTWSEPSRRSHAELAEIIAIAPEAVVVLAAGVKDNAELTDEYMRETAYPYIFVNGSDVFQEMLAPGVPTQVIFGPDGKLLQLRMGYRGEGNYATFREVLMGLGAISTGL
jgi:thiol-disulfide isomerase/thioredoxin